LNPASKKPSAANHPLSSTKQPSPVNAPVKPAAKEPAPKPKVAVTRKVITPKPKSPPVPAAAAATPQIPVSLKDAYLTTKGRTLLKKQIEALIRNKAVKQCLVGDLDKYLNVDKRLGSGSFGVVNAVSIGHHKLAVKEARSTIAIVNNPWSDKTAWSETLILKDIANPLVEQGVCPNVPILYDAFTCPSCKFEGLVGQKKKTMVAPCIVSLVELASGDLEHWFETKPTEIEIYNALFQILAGLYALQKKGQVFNGDVKSANILYYDVTPGGFWTYHIMGKQYNIPNTGKLFVINDFGTSKAFSPNFMYSFGDRKYSLGARTYTVLNGKLVPFSSNFTHDTSATLSIFGSDIKILSDFNGITNKTKLSGFTVHLNPQQIELLKRNNIPIDTTDPRFYLNIDVLPPQQFSLDVHDTLATFIGDIEASAQKGKHPATHTPAHVKAVLSPYIIPGNNPSSSLRKPHLVHPAIAHAGFLIDELFGKKNVAKFLQPLPGNPIEVYHI
jgi:hypothetical protein